MKNYIQPGDMVTVAAPAPGVKSGDLIVVGSLAGVCATTQATGDDVEIAVEGVFDLVKSTAGGSALLAGGVAYFDVGTGKITGAAAGGVPVGLALLAAADAATVARVRLFGGVAGFTVGGASAADLTALAERVTALEGA